jgi:hypothetical protein
MAYVKNTFCGDAKMTKTIEERLQKLEWELEALKSKRLPKEDQGDWLSSIIGSFEDDPDFDEIVRLGKEFRHSDRPKDDK